MIMVGEDTCHLAVAAEHSVDPVRWRERFDELVPANDATP